MKDQILQDMKKRNDESADIEGRSFRCLSMAKTHLTNRFSTEASISSLTPADLKAFHDMYYYPRQHDPAGVGLVHEGGHGEEAPMRAFGNRPSPKRVVGAIPPESRSAAPGFYRINKDVNQGGVGHSAHRARTSPDVYAPRS